MIVLNYKDGRPINEQITDKFQELILLGVMKENDPMPSVRSLAMELSINPNTIQRAYQELERRGVIYTVKGKGSFVAGVDQLKQIRSEEFYARLSMQMKEAKTLGITEEEIHEYIKNEYKEERDND